MRILYILEDTQESNHFDLTHMCNKGLALTFAVEFLIYTFSTAASRPRYCLNQLKGR